MQSTQTPTLVPLAFAANGTKNAIPENSQIGITPGAASLNDGFPPLTMTPIAAGGVPPSGADFNGVLNLITQSIRWAHGGGSYAWNSGFANDANVAGYPKGSVLMRADLTGFWISTTEGNATNPDATDGSAAGWVPGYNYGVTVVSGLTNANVTLSPLQAAKSRILVSGALTGNVSMIFPAWTKEWEVVNNTTGAFSLTATTAAGTGVTLPAGSTIITGDGTNIVQPSRNIAVPPAGDSSQKGATTAFVQGFAGGRKVVILSAMNWTVPAGVTSIWVSACAAGGGSAGSPNIPANNIVAGGGGGGAGQFVLRYPMAVTPGQVLSCVPGAAGVAGAIGAAGGNGSNTIVGSLTLNAGAGGQVGSSGAPTQAWPGQPGGNGFPNGEYGQDTSQYGPGATGGRGGCGPFGASGAPGRGAIGGVASLIAPSASYGYGVGGSGAGGCYGPTTASGTTSGSVGAAGMPGLIVIEY
ncbi:hypothetical protein [Burkholderia glumae]|uniref:glycine-rich domain-containing protein n=1 Tax=Burkholderia glumae TaxID=337 RepID=UPI00214FA833|nr:hypothetical protein [Burkholderia glumae]